MDQNDVKKLALEIIQEMKLSQAVSQSASDMTVAEFGRIFMDTYSKPHKRTWRDDHGRLKNHINPALGMLHLSKVSRKEIQVLHTSLYASPYAANRVLEQLGTMFRQAQLMGYFPDERRLPTEGIKTFPEYRRLEFIHKEDMDKIGAAIDTVKDDKYKVLFWLYLLTGCRRSELLNAQWSWLDRHRWELTIPPQFTKNGKIHVVPLSKYAAALLDTLPKQTTYIFPGGIPGKPLNKSTVWHVWDRIRKKAGMDEITIHGLRHTFASHLAQSGYSLALIGKLLNHSSARATEIYAHFVLDDRRDALDVHSEAVAKHIR